MKNKNSSKQSMFLAAELDDNIKQVYAKRLYLTEYKDLLRIEPRRNFHITLGYIANVDETDKRDIINSFKPLKETQPFMAEAVGSVVFGHYQQILCARIGPEDPFVKLHKLGAQLIAAHTNYHFDTTHPDFIPHMKIQTIRKAAGDKQDEITAAFEAMNFHKLDFKVKSLALMQREDKYYGVVYRYFLGANENGVKQNRDTDIGDVDVGR